MTSLTVKNAAKINLVLDVTGRREDGYHTIKSVFQTVGVYDEITVSLTEKDITVSCELPEIFRTSDDIPCDERNIAFKAAQLFFSETGADCGCSIHIRKGIPSQAGMGGGSSDAAAVLYILNKLTKAGLTDEKLAQLGARLGADVPFFFTAGTAFVGGIGEVIAPIADFSGRILVIAKGSDGVSTAEAYRNIDALSAPQHPDADALVKAIASGDENAHIYFGNLFEQAVQLESVSDIKKIMTASGALSAVMTGSGSAVFGMFSDSDTAEKCAEKLISCGYYAQPCKTVRESFVEI